MRTSKPFGVFLLVPLLLYAWSVTATETENVLAVVDGRRFTEADISARIEPQMIQINTQIYTTKKQALDALIGEYLLEQEANKRGISHEQLLEQEVNAKVEPVTEAEIEQVYNNNKARLGNRTLADVRDQIKQQIERGKLQQQRQAFIRSLRRAADVKVTLKPPTVNINLAGAPARGREDAPVTIVEFSDYQ